MPRLGLQILDIGFFVFHTVLVLFNLFGWAWKKTRKWNLITLSLTALSWFVMGIWFGWGYCICTDWHFRVRHALGYVDDSKTYIQLLVKAISGANLDVGLVQTVTAAGFVFGVLMSVTLNVRDWRRTRAGQTS